MAHAALLAAEDPETPIVPAPPACPEQALRTIGTLLKRLLDARYSRIPESDREDLVQEVLIDYWRRSDRILHPEAWAYAALRSRVATWTRTRKLSEQPPAAAASATEQSADDLASSADAVRQLFFTLEARCREVLGRIYCGGFTIRRLADVTREDHRAIARRRARCLKVLKSKLLGRTENAGGAT